MLNNYLFYTLSSFLLIAILVYFFVKNQYVKEKSLWWIYIILFFIFLIVNKYSLVIWIAILSALAVFEFFRNLLKSGKDKFKVLEKIIFWVLFLLLLVWFDYFVLRFPNEFILFFILISFSDIVAYFVGKSIPWKKWFTKLSPNKSLSWVIAQILFIFAILTAYIFYKNLDLKFIVLAFVVAILAPVGDLTESYFKRRTGQKDMAYYIPWHWWVLDRIDSSFISIWLIWLLIFILW
jgi:phosphatidate cytidylyltransferase